MGLFNTSAESREILEEFRRKTGIRPNMWARAALGYSLSFDSEIESNSYDSDGTEFQERTFFGDDRAVLLALLRQRIGYPVPETDIALLIKQHVERGLRLLKKEYDRLNKRSDEFLLFLSELSTRGLKSREGSEPHGFESPTELRNYSVRIQVGTETKSGTPVIHELNGPGSAPHIAIMGRNGTGKTRTGLSILSKISEVTNNSIPFLVFDYAKGDIASNESFISSIEANVISMPDQLIPMSPLSLIDRSEHSIHIAARRFRDTIKSVVRLGAIQQDRCLQIITDTYENFGDKSPELIDIASAAEEFYKMENLGADSLLSCLREFTTFPLFKPGVGVTGHELFRASHVIDIHRLPEDLRKLAVFLVLDRLYSEIMSMPDAPLDENGFRQLKLIIVIDEAHHFLPCKQPTLENIVREVRSKGVGVLLMSQSPDDFDQGRYNFAREMGLSIVFSCVLETPKMLEALLGTRIDPKRLSQLPAGVALVKTFGASEPCEVQTWLPGPTSGH